MGSKERIAREKDEVKKKILAAALEIIIAEGCQALNMRKIADRIEYAAATLYEYFDNKDSIIIELTNTGYGHLAKDLRKAEAKHKVPVAKLDEMYRAYWSFAFRQSELYKLMFRIQVSCPAPKGIIKEGPVRQLLTKAIKGVVENSSEAGLEQKYYYLWATIHGLISINFVNGDIGTELNQQILEEVILSISRQTESYGRKNTTV